jgi:hypothetical protein
MNNNLDNLDDSYPIFFPKYLFINNKQNINKQNINKQNINKQNINKQNINKQNINKQNINRENKQFNSNIQNNQFWKFKLK